MSTKPDQAQTWLTLTAVAALVYIMSGIHNTSPEEYTRLWQFQLFAFIFSRFAFLTGGAVATLCVTSWLLRRSTQPSQLTLIGMTAAVFLISEIAAWGLSGR